MVVLGSRGEGHGFTRSATVDLELISEVNSKIMDPSGLSDDILSRTSGSTAQKPLAPLFETTPKIRERSRGAFVKVSSNDEEKYAIEVMVTDPEALRAKKHPAAAVKHVKDSDRSSKPQSKAPASSSATTVPVPEKIRINSFYILDALSNIDSEIDPVRPLIMESPYKLLVHYQKQIRDYFSVLERQRNELRGKNPSSDATKGSDSKELPEAGTPGDMLQDVIVKFCHFKCLIDFIERYIFPTIDRLQDDAATEIRFGDLWYIFSPGETIYMPIKYSLRTVGPEESLKLPETLRGRYNRMWRVVGIGDDSNNMSTIRRENNTRIKPFSVKLYHVDFDGKFYIPITHSFEITPFEGEREITSLDFYPVRFSQNTAPARAAKEKSGAPKNFLSMGIFDMGTEIFECLRRSYTHFYYAGPTLLTQPCGCPFPDGEVQQTYIESEVIVDFRAALIQHPSWRPDPAKCRKPQRMDRDFEERSAMAIWSGQTRSQTQNLGQDPVSEEDWVDMEMESDFRNHEQIFATISSSWTCNESAVPAQDTALLPPRMFAFVLRTRSFAPVYLCALKPIRPQTDALHDLQLKDDSLKDTVEALVRTHFLTQQMREVYSKGEDYGLRGRCEGLVILLHGAPGVGKTLTAESLAAANGKPLFQISCGDLGLHPKEVETSLKDIFRYAQMWKCVLLLDECDVFLAQRSKDDLKRNALVCVFLRVLEFYTGILFLTTNRVGVIDDAVRSRITWMAYYPPLNWAQTKGIWKNNVRSLEIRNPRVEIDKKSVLRFAKKHFRQCQQNRATWDGRQIQNCFQVAVSLAEWDLLSDQTKHDAAARMNDEEVRKPYILDESHFVRTASNVEETVKYLRRTRGFDSAEIAYNAMERDDEFQPENDTIPLVRTPSQHDDQRERRPSFNAGVAPRRNDSIVHPGANGSSQMYSTRSIPSQVQTGSGRRSSTNYNRNGSSPVVTSPRLRQSSLSVVHHPADERRLSQTRPTPNPGTAVWPGEDYASSTMEEDEEHGPLDRSDSSEWDD